MSAPPPAPPAPPAPKPTDYAAVIEDLEIIATGEYSKINARRTALEQQRNPPGGGGPTEGSPEYNALTKRIDTLAAAEKKAKKDKGSKKSDDDLAYWSGRVANASTNAFSASVNGVSVGVTGGSISVGVASWSIWGVSDSTVGLAGSQTGTKMDITGAAEKAAASNMRTFVQSVVGVASLNAAIAQEARAEALANLNAAMRVYL